MKKNRILLVCALALGLPSAVSSLMHNQDNIIAKAVESTVTQEEFDSISGNLNGNENIEYLSEQGGGTALPQSNGGEIRLYQGKGSNSGGKITIKVKNDLKIKSITIGSSMATTVSHSLDEGDDLKEKESLSANGKYTLDNLNNTKVTFYCWGTSKTTRLYVNYLSVTYDDGIVQTGNKISFDSNGGTSVENQYVETNNKITKPNDPTKNGYKFLGWYYNEQLWNFETTINGEMTLIAKWGDLDLTKIKNVNTENVYYRISGEVVAQSNFQTIFVQDETGALQIYQQNQYFKGKVQVGDDVTLVGKYGLNKGNPQLIDIIDFKVNNSDDKIDTLPLTNISEVTKENTNKYFKLEKLKIKSEEKKPNSYTYTLNDYDFVLYYSNNTFVDGYDKLIVGSYVDVEGALVIYNNNNKETLEILVTKVVESQRFIVTFNSNGGSNVESQKVFPGEKITKPTNPTKQADGYTTYEFAGWFTDSGLTQEYDFNSEVNEDITLYAKWNSKTLSYSEIFTTMQTKSKLSAKYTKNIEEQTETVFEKVTTDLKDWSGTYLITYNDSICFDGSLETLDKTSNTQLVSAVDNRITGSSYLDYIFTFEKTTNNNYSIQSKSGYYIGRTSTSNGLDSSKSKKYDLSISYNNGISIISSKCYLNFNEAKDQTRFRFFKNEQSPIDLYKLVESKTSYTITDASIRYGATIPSAAYDENANYGLLVTSGTLFDVLGETMTDLYSIADANEDNKVSKEEFISALDINLEIETTDYNSLIPVKTDANGKADENGEYYQFGINFTSALNHIDTKLCAIAYMEINGEIFITKETNYSLRTLAQKYIDEKILADNEDATSVLNAIVSYKK